MPLLSTGGQALVFRDKNEYPLLTTVAGDSNQFAGFLIKILQRFNWYVNFIFWLIEFLLGKNAATYNAILIDADLTYFIRFYVKST